MVRLKPRANKPGVVGLRLEFDIPDMVRLRPSANKPGWMGWGHVPTSSRWLGWGITALCYKQTNSVWLGWVQGPSNLVCMIVVYLSLHVLWGILGSSLRFGLQFGFQCFRYFWWARKGKSVIIHITPQFMLIDIVIGYFDLLWFVKQCFGNFWVYGFVF